MQKKKKNRKQRKNPNEKDALSDLLMEIGLIIQEKCFENRI